MSTKHQNLQQDSVKGGSIAIQEKAIFSNRFLEKKRQICGKEGGKILLVGV